MKAEDRAKKVMRQLGEEFPRGSCGNAQYWPWASMEKLLVREILAIRNEAVEECTKEAIEYGNRVPAARAFSRQIGRGIYSLLWETECVPPEQENMALSITGVLTNSSGKILAEG